MDGTERGQRVIVEVIIEGFIQDLGLGGEVLSNQCCVELVTCVVLISMFSFPDHLKYTGKKLYTCTLQKMLGCSKPPVISVSMNNAN